MVAAAMKSFPWGAAAIFIVLAALALARTVKTWSDVDAPRKMGIIQQMAARAGIPIAVMFLGLVIAPCGDEVFHKLSGAAGHLLGRTIIVIGFVAIAAGLVGMVMTTVAERPSALIPPPLRRKA